MTLAFVPHEEFMRWIAKGWLLAATLGECHHGRYSVLMVRA